MVLYFCPFSLMNLYFHRSNAENSYKHALLSNQQKCYWGTANRRVVNYQLINVLKVGRIMVTIKVITKSKIGSLAMQSAKHDVTGMPLYRMYLYPIRSSTLWLAIHILVLLVNTISKIILESFEKFCQVLRNNTKSFEK